jgi:hypothetical protein
MVYPPVDLLAVIDGIRAEKHQTFQPAPPSGV